MLISLPIRVDIEYVGLGKSATIYKPTTWKWTATICLAQAGYHIHHHANTKAGKGYAVYTL